MIMQGLGPWEVALVAVGEGEEKRFMGTCRGAEKDVPDGGEWKLSRQWGRSARMHTLWTCIRVFNWALLQPSRTGTGKFWSSHPLLLTPIAIWGSNIYWLKTLFSPQDLMVVLPSGENSHVCGRTADPPPKPLLLQAKNIVSFFLAGAWIHGKPPVTADRIPLELPTWWVSIVLKTNEAMNIKGTISQEGGRHSNWKNTLK